MYAYTRRIRGSGFASGSLRSSVDLLQIAAEEGVQARRLVECAAGLPTVAHRGEVVPEEPVAAVFRDRLPVALAGLGEVPLGRLRVAELPPRIRLPAPPAGSLARLRAGLLVAALAKGPLARPERARADQPDEGDHREDECGRDAGRAQPQGQARGRLPAVGRGEKRRSGREPHEG